MTAVNMPRLSDSMEEGTILRWLVQDRSEIKRGEELVEIETDKATMVYEADESGFLRIVAREGQTLSVGTVIAHVLATADAEPEPAYAPAGPAAIATGDVAEARPREISDESQHSRVKASPLARRLASDRGLDLVGVVGSGPGGRVVKADVDALAASADSSRPETTAANRARTPTPTAKGHVVYEELTRIQQVVVRRMSESRATIPDFQLRTRVDVTSLVRLRLELATHGTRLSVNDFVVKACGQALRAHPRANGAYHDGRFELYERVNVGVAVAAPDALFVPTVFDADAKPVAEISTETRRLAARVREGNITPPELAGGTFTVSNLGMFGITGFNAVINPGQAAILAVGAAETRIATGALGIKEHQIIELTLSCDHRILYGADAAEFLTTIRDGLEAPAALLI